MTGAPVAVETQLDRVLASTPLLGAETVAVADAAGRTLRAPVRAAVDIPVFDNSAMDGFAVRFADVHEAGPAHPVALTVVADLPAGTAEDPPLGAGQAARIMTGSPVPTDADAIVPFEDTAGGLADSLGTVTVQRAPRTAGAHIRRTGEDVRAGDEVLPAGIVLGAWQQGAAAAAGVAEVTVARRPRVAVISTGSELVAPGQSLQRGQIPESNSVLLAGLALAAGAEVVHRTSVDDEGRQLQETLAKLLAAVDVVVFSGGVSAGAYEVVKNELAGAMAFTKVAMQPGKPQGFGVADSGALLFGLPGNPVSAAVSFEVFVRPALCAMQGRTTVARPVLRLPASTAWRTPPGRRQFLPAAIDRSDPARWTAGPATPGGSGSHRAGGLGVAEAYIVVPAEVDAVAAGDAVDVWMLEG
ncbi:molybdopterin molybdotransferase MoeA [Microbacterium sp. MC2]